MKFNEYKYERVDIDAVKSQMNALLERFKNASSVEEQLGIVDEVQVILDRIETLVNIANIRHDINTKDEFYDAENEHIDMITPYLDEIETRYYKCLLESEFKEQLQEKLGDFLFDKARLKLKVFSADIIEDMQEENRLTSEYAKLIASAEIEFNGEVMNLSKLAAFAKNPDRALRKSASRAWSKFFAENEAKFDEIYDKLVKVRHRMATKLGYENYVQYGYDLLGRTDYNAQDVARYREQIRREVLPVVLEIKEAQRKRLGLESLMSYDLEFDFADGNATPKGTKDELVAAAKKMYSELSSETGEFFDFMVDGNLLNLDTKPGKKGGGYCTFLPDYKAPFIFANFNGTSADVDVLTHEAGHAFQVYSTSKNNKMREYMWPTYEACEIHSMSMEFLTWPWMELFFKEEADKYKYSHLCDGLVFLPYGISVDEFQHFVYENPQATPDERKAKWREIEKKNMPYKVYDEDEIMERGLFWFKQGHIFESPFYYIDYTLAQVCAYQFWNKSQIDRESAWEEYYRLCKEGGKRPFLSLLPIGNLENPFVEGTISNIIKPIKKWLGEHEI